MNVSFLLGSWVKSHMHAIVKWSLAPSFLLHFERINDIFLRRINDSFVN